MTAAWTAAITSKMHAAGFIAVSARFHSLSDAAAGRTKYPVGEEQEN
jgi:hypothetical protein